MHTQIETNSIPPLRERSETRSGAVVAGAFAGSGVAAVAIGFFHVLAEAFPAVKSFLTLHTGIGPYSGKVLLGYVSGALVAVLFPVFVRQVSESPWPWVKVMLVGLVLGTLMVFAPVTHWLAEVLK